MSSLLPPPEDEPFMRAILAELEDDAPRLVYADRLLERGDPRGELIVVQCLRQRLQREGKAHSAECCAAYAREREILSAHRAGWLEPLELHSWAAEVTRGFVGCLSMPWSALRDSWPLVSQLPLDELTLRPLERFESSSLGTIAWLASQPSARRLARIGVGFDHTNGRARFHAPSLLSTFEDQDDEREIWPHREGLPDARCDHALRTLSWSWPTPRMVEDLSSRGESLPLEAFSITQADKLSPNELRALVSAPAIRNVEELVLGLVSDGAASAALEGPAFPHLKSLTLTAAHASETRHFGPAMAKSALVRNLTALRTDVVLTDVVMTALEEQSPALEDIRLEQKLSGRMEGLEYLLASSIAPRLRVLSLEGYASVKDLVAGPFERLEWLALTRAAISDEDAALLARAFPNVHAPSFTSCYLGPSARAILAERWPSFGLEDVPSR